MRSITAQLEQQVAHWRNTSQIAAQLLHDHQREIEELRQAQAVATQSDQILHYRDGYTRFSNIAEAMGQDAVLPAPSTFAAPVPTGSTSPSATSSGSRAAPPTASTSSTSGRARKAQRTSSPPRRGAPSRSRSPPRKRPASSRSTRRADIGGWSKAGGSSQAPSDISEAEIDDSTQGGSQPHSSSTPAPEMDTGDDEMGADDEGFEEESRAALSRSRSERRRSSGTGVGSSNRPIDLSTGGTGGSPGQYSDESSGIYIYLRSTCLRPSHRLFDSILV